MYHVHPIGALLQAKEEVDQLSKLTRDRSNLAFDSATVIELIICPDLVVVLCCHTQSASFTF